MNTTPTPRRIPGFAKQAKQIRLLHVFAAATLLLLAALLHGAGNTAWARDDLRGFSGERLARIDARMSEAVAEGLMVGGVGLIARHGEVVYTAAWGEADREKGRPMREDTLFRIYSMTKPITSVALLMLYEEGHFLLADPVAKYLPEFGTLEVLDGDNGTARLVTRPPTIRDLLRHTAGLSYGVFGNTEVDRLYLEARLFDAPDLAAFSEQLAALPLLYEPGTRWHYSLATDVQGRLVEVLSGMSLGEFFEERIFRPLAMKDTFFRVPGEKTPRLAQLYSPVGTSAGWEAGWVLNAETQLEVADPALSEPYLEGRGFESGGAGLVSTAGDYLRFASMLAGGGALGEVRLLAPGTVALMHSNHLQGIDRSELYGMDSFGLGVGSIEDPAAMSGELSGPGSYGWGGAAGTDFWVDPERGIVGIFMVQSIPHQTTLAKRFRVLTYQALLN